jgi:ferrous iron transport protein B
MTGVILIGSIVVWTLSAFPRNLSYSRDYTAEIQALNTSYSSQINTATDSEKKQLLLERDAALSRLLKANKAEQAERSYMGRIGKLVAPIFAPLGIDWRGSVALLTGFFAKEIVVSTLGILYVTGDEPEALQNALLSSGMTSLGAFAMMAFVLLYVPCLATVASIRRETGSAKWTIVSIVYSTLTAWVLAFGVYQGGRLIGLS